MRSGLKLEDVLAQIDEAVGNVKTAEESCDDEKEPKESKKEEKPEDKGDSEDDEGSEKKEDKELPAFLQDKAASADAAILAAIESAIGEAEKTAADVSEEPISDLMKLAQSLNEEHFDGILKKADIIAQAIADGVVGRLQAYEKAAQDLQHERTLSALAAAPTKVASDEQGLLKQAAEQGYADAMEQLTKVAAAQFEAGYNNASQIIVHNAVFTKAASDMTALIELDRKASASGN